MSEPTHSTFLIILGELISFDDDTRHKLTQLARDRIGTFQELADEALADRLKKHVFPSTSRTCGDGFRRTRRRKR